MHTILSSTRNAAGSELVEEHPEYAAASRDAVEAAADRLTAEDLAGAKYRAVMTLAGVTQHTKPGQLSIHDLRFLASEAADLDFYDQAPDWAREAMDSLPTRRSFSEKTVKHMLSAIRAIKGTNVRLGRQVERSEAQPITRRG